MKYFLTLFLLLVTSISIVLADEITPISQLKPDMSTTIKGEVAHLLDEDEFLIQDATGKIEVYIGWKNRLSFSNGETLTIRGFVDDEDSYTQLEFYASEITREDGSVFQLQQD